MSPPQPRSALLVIDVQSGFLHPTNWGPSRSNPEFESNLVSLLSTYRSLISSATTSSSSPSPHRIIHVQHSSLQPTSPLHPSSDGYSFLPIATPQETELVIQKHVNSAFIGTDLEAVLRAHFFGSDGSGTAGSAKLWIVGLSTDHCVSTTTRMAANLGVCDDVVAGKGEVVLVEDATAAWKKGDGDGWFEAELVHKVHAESLREFASIRRTDEVLGMWRCWMGVDEKM